jgi:tetratricopeptide (TPR) repeat protein
MQMNLYRALAAACMGRFGEARQRFAEASTTAMQIGPPAWHAAVTVSAAEPEALLGDPRRARAAADAALALDHDPLTLRSAAMAFAWTGDVARARALLDRYEAGPHDGLGLKPAWLAIGRALVEARTEDPARALERLKPAGPFERGRDFELAPLVIRASIERSAGRPGEAAATFREVLRLRGVSPVSPWGAYARLGLARALRDSGDKAGSIAAYDAFLESWKDADPDAQLLKIARQERTTLSR